MKKIKIREDAKAPLYVLALFAMLMLSSISKLANLDSLTEAFIASILLEVFVFGLPTFFFLKYVDKGSLSSIKIIFRLRNPALTASLLFTALFGFLLINSLSYIIGLAGADFTSCASYVFSGISTETNVIYVIVAFGIIPTLIEELAFRGIVYRSYLKYGTVYAIVISALVYAMSHFSIASFGAHFFTGLVLGYSLRMTGTLLTPIIIRFFLNILSVYFLPALWNVIIQPMGILFAMFIVVALFFTFFIISLYLSEKYFSRLATTLPEKGSVYMETKKEKALTTYLKILGNPVFIAASVLFLSVTLIIHFA